MEVEIPAGFRESELKVNAGRSEVSLRLRRGISPAVELQQDEGSAASSRFLRL
jgi:hypothetical protein